MNVNVTVVDYGIGNIHSVVKAFRHVGADVRLTSEPDVIEGAHRLVVPGVGAFADGMNRLKELGIDAPIRRHANSGRPLLGICLGMQLLMTRSQEFGDHEGLGIIEGTVIPLMPADGFKVPQIGWNSIHPVGPGDRWTHPLFAGLPASPMLYFVHSYTASPARETDRLADADYGAQRVSAALARDNVIGFQFHPEKSGTLGLEILHRFMEYTEARPA